MSNCNITIWDRAFELSVIYECYSGEEVLASQRESLAMLEENVQEVADSLEAVKEYVRETSAGQLGEDRMENIFRYVMPKTIFVPHTEKHRLAAILCHYKFDMEHGMAVVFEDGKLKEIGQEDIAL